MNAWDHTPTSKIPRRPHSNKNSGLHQLRGPIVKGSLTLFIYIPCQNIVPQPTSRLAISLRHPQHRLMTTSEQTNPTQQVWPPILHDEETDLGKQARRKAEAASKRISDKIDKEIERERQKREREAGPKLLLLGASPF